MSNTLHSLVRKTPLPSDPQRVEENRQTDHQNVLQTHKDDGGTTDGRRLECAAEALLRRRQEVLGLLRLPAVRVPSDESH